VTPLLSEATRARLPAGVARFGYDRDRAQAGVVHLGIGAFHRAHQAAVFDRLLETDLRWAVRAASLRSSTVRDAMAPQDGLYSLVVRDGEAEHVRLVGAVRDVLVAPERPSALVDALAAPKTRLVTLTVTEKGYLPDAAERPAEAPRTAAGFIAAALALRRQRRLPPFAVISCDNLPDNGTRLREAVLASAVAVDPRLADWIGEQVAFPKTMVDRIVPATDEADVEALAGRIGLVDRAMVKAEPFCQWVIEEFEGERPDFESAGVQMTADVEPWEEAKLRLLNGAHSAIAYLGGLAGIRTVDRFVADPAGRAFVGALWDEAQATLTPPPGLDLAAYRKALMRRFANSALGHRTRQIAIDGSQKLPQRLLAPIAARLRRGQPIEALALAVAGWVRWQDGRTDAGEAFDVDDPLASRTAALLAPQGSPAAQVEAIVSLEIFPGPLAANAEFRAALTRQLERLASLGARRAVLEFAAQRHE
jgi:fructuronate reductase